MLAVTGGKGGCGKTTTALGLAEALARRGAEPLVVDADVDMPDLHLLAGVQPDPSATALAGGAHVECVCHRPRDSPKVAIVPAGDADHTPAALRAVRSWSGPVLVDCPAGAGEDATVPLRHADASVLVTTDAPQALSDAAKTAAVADRLDGPVRGVLVRGPGADDIASPVPDVPVERVNIAPDENVLMDERFQLTMEQLSESIFRTIHMSK